MAARITAAVTTATLPLLAEIVVMSSPRDVPIFLFLGQYVSRYDLQCWALLITVVCGVLISCCRDIGRSAVVPESCWSSVEAQGKPGS